MNIQPCSGLKVIAATTALGAPFAAYQLAMHGAEVINVEAPATGDSARRSGGAEAKEFVDAGMAPGFLAHAGNKKSITLNLQAPQGQEIFRKLVGGADLVIENFRVGTMDRFGLGYSSLQVVNPRLIYCSLSGFGQTGPRRFSAALDPVIQAASGLMTVTGTPETGPLKVGATIMDYASGYSLTVGILMALLQRSQTGKGLHVDVSMLETSLSLMSSTVSEVMNAGMKTRLMGNQLQNENHVCDSFKCQDTYIFIAATRESLRQKLWGALHRPDIPADPRFTDISAIRRNIALLKVEIEKSLSEKPAKQWEVLLNNAGVPAMQVYSINEITADEQVAARGFFQELKNVPGVHKSVNVPLAPYRLSDGEAKLHSPPPRLGQHTDEILASLGYTPDEVRAFRKERVV